MERLDSKMKAFEETVEVQRQEIEMNDDVLDIGLKGRKTKGCFSKASTRSSLEKRRKSPIVIIVM